MTPASSPDPLAAEPGAEPDPVPVSHGTFAIFRRPNGNVQLVVRFAGAEDETFFPPAEWGGLPADMVDQAQAMFADMAGGAAPLSVFRRLRAARKMTTALRS
jgi:hypothetical protein